MQKNQEIHTDTQTNTLGATAAAMTSLLGRRVTNEPEHIVLALEMSRGVKMSPQIAPGHQMSPFHSTPLPSSYSVLNSPLSHLPLPLCFLSPGFTIRCSFPFCPLLLPSHLSTLYSFFISSKGQGGEE